MGGRGNRTYAKRIRKDPDQHEDREPSAYDDYTQHIQNGIPDPPYWSKEALEAWMQHYPDWEKPAYDDEHWTDTDYEAWERLHPGWYEQEGLVNPNPPPEDPPIHLPTAEDITAWQHLKEALSATLENMDDSAQILTRDWIQARTDPEKVTLQDDFMATPQDFYVIEVNGIKVYYPQLDTLEDAVIFTVQELAITELPPLLHRYIDSIILTPQSGGDIGGFGPVVASAGDGDNRIVIYNGEGPSSLTLAHEAAHNLATGKYGQPTPPAFSDYAQAMRSDEPPVSDYAYTGAGEDFAEAIALYVTNPNRLKLIAPNRFAVIARLMSDPAYRG